MASVTLTWNANPAADNVTAYEVWGANGTSIAFGSCTKLATVSGLTWTDVGLPNSQPRTYYIVADNVVGSSSPEGPINITTVAAAAQPFGFAFEYYNPVVSKVIGYFDSPLAWTLPSSLPNCTGKIVDSDTASAVAPTAQTDFDIQSPVGTSIGTMRFAASSLTATFIKASSSSIAAAQVVAIVAPANLNGLTGAVIGTLEGTR